MKFHRHVFPTVAYEPVTKSGVGCYRVMFDDASEGSNNVLIYQGIIYLHHSQFLISSIGTTLHIKSITHPKIALYGL